eukprot:SAG22_NODE_87_length_21437_cov_14.162480_5_plen_143_part_00
MLRPRPPLSFRPAAGARCHTLVYFHSALSTRAAAAAAAGTETDATIELTHNWEGEDAAKMDPQGDRKFGHIAIGVDDIYAVCAQLQNLGYAILRPPRDGHMAFVKTPDGASIELLQTGGSLPAKEPWKSMASVTNPDGSFTW